MHRCSAKCCDDTSNSMEKVQSCIDRCQEPLLKAQTDFQNQFKAAQVKTNNSFTSVCVSFPNHSDIYHSLNQDRLNRCITQCNDEANDQYQADTSSDKDVSIPAGSLS